jgi:hypothetical protein
LWRASAGKVEREAAVGERRAARVRALESSMAVVLLRVEGCGGSRSLDMLFDGSSVQAELTQLLGKILFQFEERRK